MLPDIVEAEPVAGPVANLVAELLLNQLAVEK